MIEKLTDKQHAEELTGARRFYGLRKMKAEAMRYQVAVQATNGEGGNLNIDSALCDEDAILQAGIQLGSVLKTREKSWRVVAVRDESEIDNPQHDRPSAITSGEPFAGTYEFHLAHHRGQGEHMSGCPWCPFDSHPDSKAVGDGFWLIN
jgi:hypothetical protein